MRNSRMDRISRRQVVQGAAAAAAVTTLRAPAVHAQNDRQTLRFVAQADLKILDPVWTTGYITRNHGYLVYDTLFGTDANVPFMMPARIASTPPEEQIKEIVGSGPFKFARDEWQPGEQAVYLRNPDYIPRDESPSGSTGGKKVYLNKVVWRYIPDPWDAADALSAGEVDWWEDPPLDFIPKIEQNPDLQTFLFDPLGTQGWLRPNCLHPPFNNQKARQALLHMMDQVTYLAWAVGQSEYYHACPSVFACGSPYATRTGAEPIIEHDLAKARQLVEESGYDGRPVVVLQTTDRPILNAAAVVTRQRLESIGFKVILKGLLWSTYLVVRARNEPPDKGGWNLLHTNFQAADVINPAVHFALSGAGPRAWYGWPDIPQLEKLTSDWVRETDLTKRRQLADEIQKAAFSEVPYVPWGEWMQPTAFRKNVREVLKFAAPIFWNVRVT